MKKRAKQANTYTVTDHKGMVLNLESDGGKWLVVTCPFDPELVTQARNIDEAFLMAYDAKKLLDECRAEMMQTRGTPNEKGVRRRRETTPRKSGPSPRRTAKADVRT